jgi:hypothetical protein
VPLISQPNGSEVRAETEEINNQEPESNTSPDTTTIQDLLKEFQAENRSKKAFLKFVYLKFKG